MKIRAKLTPSFNYFFSKFILIKHFDLSLSDFKC